MIGQEINNIKKAIELEFQRRGKSDYTVYNTAVTVGEKALVEHGKKILQDCYTMDNSNNWISRVSPGGKADKNAFTDAITYIKTLAVQPLVK